MGWYALFKEAAHMNKKLGWLLRPGAGIFFVFLMGFAVAAGLMQYYVLAGITLGQIRNDRLLYGIIHNGIQFFSVEVMLSYAVSNLIACILPYLTDNEGVLLLFSDG